MGRVTKLEQPHQRTRLMTYKGRIITNIRWHQGDIVLDFDGPNLKSLVVSTDDLYDEDGMRLDYEGTA